jgi:hypothetical protein
MTVPNFGGLVLPKKVPNSFKNIFGCYPKLPKGEVFFGFNHMMTEKKAKVGHFC